MSNLTREMKWHPDFEDGSEFVRCPLCGKKLKTEKLYIHVGGGGNQIVHIDVTEAEGDMGWFAVGSDCARNLGAGWTKELPPIDPLSTAD